MWLLLASAWAGGDIYRYVREDGAWVITDSPQHEGFDLVWDDPEPGAYLPNGVPMPRLDRIRDLDTWDATFLQAAADNGVPAELLKAMAVVESRMNPLAVSPAGAQGLMQLMPATARHLGVADPFDPVQSIRGGAAFVADQLARFHRTELAVAAYNAGPGAVSRAGGIPPIRETQTYVDRVLGLYQHFRDTRPLLRGTQ